MTEFHRVIDIEAFKESLSLFDDETIAEIIDIFLQEYPQKIKILEESILRADSDTVLFQAHSLKGVIANFGAPQALLNIKLLEEYAKKSDISECSAQYKLFKPLGDQLAQELIAIKKNLLI